MTYFNSVASDYDTYRPDYPPELIDTILLTHSPVLALGAELAGFRTALMSVYAATATVTEELRCRLVLARRP